MLRPHPFRWNLVPTSLQEEERQKELNHRKAKKDREKLEARC